MRYHRKTAVLCAVMLMLCGCGRTGSPDAEETETEFVTETAPYQSIVNPDFRNILWGMMPNEIYSQESSDDLHFYSDIGDYCEQNGLESPDIDMFGTNGGCPVLEFGDITEVGFRCRLFYFLGDMGTCTSAEYVIPPEEKQRHGSICMDTINTYFDEMYCPAEISPVPGYIYRRTRTAEIFISEPRDGSVHIFFRKPENTAETPQTSRVIEYDNGTTIDIRN